MARFVKQRQMYDRVIGVDIADTIYPDHCDVFIQHDLRDATVIPRLMKGVDHVFHFAADMGGLGYLDGNDAQVMYNNAQIDLNVIGGAAEADNVTKLLYTSSAVVYPEEFGNPGAFAYGLLDVEGLRESDAWHGFPAEGGYGVEKLFTESLCRYVTATGNLDTRVVRLHNVFGPERCLGITAGKKAPAALCRKVADRVHARDGKRYYVKEVDGVFEYVVEIDIWGDGKQTRSFLYIDDALRGISAVMASSYTEPLNIGSDRLVSINELADIIGAIAGVTVVKNHIEGPVGVRGRNSNNDLVSAQTGWRPMVPLEEGLRETYGWISNELLAKSKQ